jgi:hypothetical protein
MPEPWPHHTLPALTVWQPWATLIVAGARPYEFRGWQPPRSYIGKTIAIHAGARPMRMAEVRALILQLKPSGLPGSSGLIDNIAAPILYRARTELQRRRANSTEDERALFEEVGLKFPAPLPLASIVGTATLGEPTKNPIVAGRHLVADSDRVDHLNWAWPMLCPAPIEPPVPARGAQGIWRWRMGGG